MTDIKKVCCYGVGMIGAGWAVAFAWAGLDVNMLDLSQDALDAGMARVKKGFASLARNGVLTKDEINSALARIKCYTNPKEALADVQYIQESVLEHFNVKHAVVEAVEKYAPTDTIFGSSTSNMKITDIAAPATHKERYIGAHPYNPPYLLPLVELNSGEGTDPKILQRAYEFFKEIGKEPVVLKKEVAGFICNRIQNAVWRELRDLIGKGVITVEDADKAITFGPGMRWALMGPSRCQQLSSVGGIAAQNKNIHGSGVNVVADLATWGVVPPE
jgi:3-hydroxyacyl-CoA dehydrogenase